MMDLFGAQIADRIPGTPTKSLGRPPQLTLPLGSPIPCLHAVVYIQLRSRASILAALVAATYGHRCAIAHLCCEDPGRSPAIPPLTSPLAHGIVQGFLS